MKEFGGWVRFLTALVMSILLHFEKSLVLYMNTKLHIQYKDLCTL